MLRLCQNFGTASFFTLKTKNIAWFTLLSFSGKMLGAQKQKHKKQPFSDASASHLSLVLWHV